MSCEKNANKQKEGGFGMIFLKKVKWLDCRANFTKVSPIGVTRDGSDSRNRKYFFPKRCGIKQNKRFSSEKKNDKTK